jgi:hypothetical protein
MWHPYRAVGMLPGEICRRRKIGMPGLLVHAGRRLYNVPCSSGGVVPASLQRRTGRTTVSLCHHNPAG